MQSPLYSHTQVRSNKKTCTADVIAVFSRQQQLIFFVSMSSKERVRRKMVTGNEIALQLLKVSPFQA